MGTFFDKIASPYINPPELPAPDEEEGVPKRPERKPRIAKSTTEGPQSFQQKSEQKPMPKETRLKIDADESNLAETSEEREEDGELTVDIYDNGDSIMIQSTVAGVKPEDLDISITADSVTIRGKRKQSEEVRDEDYYYKELFWGSFSRSIILPEEIEDAEAEANLKHGLLTIRLPKKKRNVVQKLKVKVT